MLKNYLTIALRNLRLQKTFTTINLAGLAIGLACCILILLWIQDEVSFETFNKNKDRLYQLLMHTAEQPDRIGSTIPFALAPILKNEFPEIAEYTRLQYRSIYETCIVSRGDKVFYEDGLLLADPSFFHMFSYNFVHGDPNSALTDPNSMVITKDMAKKYFGDQDPIGKMLQVNNQLEFTVTAVIENTPHNSELQFDIVAPIQVLGEEKLQSWSWESSSILLLRRDASVTDLKKKIVDSIDRHRAYPGMSILVKMEPQTRMHLYYGAGDIRLVYVFTAVALFILIIACINYMNLTTAQFNKRAKEVGLRKVVGAQKNILVVQFFSESLLLVLFAMIFAIGLVYLSLPVFNNLTQKNLTLFASGNYTVLFGLLGLTLLVGLVAGSYPALFLSSFKPVTVLRGALKTSAKSSLRRVLVVAQFTIAIILIICTLVVFQQHNYLIHKKLGYNQNHIIYLPINRDILQKYRSFKQTLLQHSDIKNVTVASSLPHSIGNTNPIEDWDGKSSDDLVLSKFAITDHDYIKTFEMEILKGRDFSKENPTDVSNFIININAAELMNLEDPLDKQMSYMGIQGTIIGLIDNFHNRPLDEEINPLVLLTNPNHYDYFLQDVFIKINSGNIPETIKSIENIYNDFASTYPFEFRFLDEAVERTYSSIQQMARLFEYFALLAIFISCLGLFALSLFMGEQRTKEIGVRKSLGAGVSSIILLLSNEFTRWVLLANLLAWPIAWMSMKRWLQNFVYRSELTVLPFILAGLLALLIALLTVGWQAVRTARANPVEALRYE